ncbi:MAG: amidinotransferase [Acidobacteria bacterium]|uniref:arginine deiminase n=1 Tax=Candidatus Sulfomarinibacter kjeldsenii TaxID=2885994 RepID=A0A8J6Y6D4_9BACT|nr:amidinotransferase [Candidatus Sulfomarinibacter kjeldsenii]
MKSFGSQSMVEPLKKVLVRRPDEAFGSADPKHWHYISQPELEGAQAEHDALVAILREAGCEVLYHEVELPEHADAIFTHDPVIVTDEGSIILRMGKEQRRGEEAAIGKTLEDLSVPTLATLEGEATAEGGDLLWLDHDTLAVGRGYRTNAEGLRQLTAALRPLGVETVEVQLPHGDGPVSCLHLMSIISMLDHDLAVVHIPLLPVPFVEMLSDRGIELVEVPDEEYPTMGPNVLALAPRRCLMIEGNPVTRERLETAGCEVLTYRGEELSLKAEGGATCLTRPILRST